MTIAETRQAAESLRRFFAIVSGLKTHHASIEPREGRFRLQFDGKNLDGSRFSISSELVPVDRFKKTTKKLAILQKNNVMEKTGEEIKKPIDYSAAQKTGDAQPKKAALDGKGKDFTERLKKFRAARSASLDARGLRYNELEKRHIEQEQRLDRIEANDKAELDAIDAELRQMGNDL